MTGSPPEASPAKILVRLDDGHADQARRIDDATAFFCENLRRYVRGQRLLNLVDKRLGFPIRPGETER